MANEIVFSGFGGQGVVTGALVMAHICLAGGMNVTNVPQYGKEQRGGAASSCTKFALPPAEIYDPREEHPDVLIALTGAAYTAHAPFCKDGAIVLCNTNMGEYDEKAFPALRLYKFPTLDVADAAGSSRAANFVMMGAAIKLTGWFSAELCLEEIERYFKNVHREKLIASNLQAFRAGYDYPFEKV